LSCSKFYQSSWCTLYVAHWPHSGWSSGDTGDSSGALSHDTGGTS
jgi:hypothetical protein